MHTLPLSENICSPLEVYSQHGDHSSAPISTPPPPPQLGAVPRLGSKRIRAARSWKCAAGGRSIKLLSGRQNKPACGKNNAAPGAKGPDASPHRVALAVSGLRGECDHPNCNSLPPTDGVDRKGKTVLLFIGSCSARMMSMRELSRECMFRLSYILERSWKTHRCEGLFFFQGRSWHKQTRVAMRA